MRVAKYRGSFHGTNEYPFLIDEKGISVIPITSLNLEHEALGERISSGIPKLDEMLDAKGYYRGSSILISGAAGCGKSSMAAYFADATCRRGERCLSFLFEESPSQLIRNMGSIGLDLAQWVSNGLLQLHAARPSIYGLEMHLATMIKVINEYQPHVVILDPISAFWSNEENLEIKAMLTRLIDYLKEKGITAMLLNLSVGGEVIEKTNTAISSLIDTWLLLQDIELNGERNRGLYILKSRGMAHSNQIREFIISESGIELKHVYLGTAGVLSGSSRLIQEAKDETERLRREQEVENRILALESKRKAMEAKIIAIRTEFEYEEANSLNVIAQEQAYQAKRNKDAEELRISRHAEERGEGFEG